MADRHLEPPNMSGDLWPIGFDVDIALDSSTKNGLNNMNSNTLHNTNNNNAPNGYADVQQMFFNKLDDLNERDISQITDLTNSLPKGDVSSAHNLYAKFSCQELAYELATAHDPVPKSSQNNFASSAPSQETLLIQKPVYSMDIFGKVAFHDGKLTLQLKSFQMAPHFSNNIEECWICKEKFLSNVESHKHTLHGLFQINAEYVQIDIDQYLLPVPAVSIPSSDMKFPLNSLDLVSISDNNLSSAEVYQPFRGRMSEADCTQPRIPCEINQVKNKVHSIQSTRSIEDISFTPSLVSHVIKSQQPQQTNFNHTNLPSIGVSNDRMPPDGSSLINSSTPYLLPHLSTSESVLADKSRLPHNMYSNVPTNEIDTYQNLFTNQCQYSQLSSGGKSFVDDTDSTKMIEVEKGKKKGEVGAKKRKSKVVSKKHSVIKMRGEIDSLPRPNNNTDQTPLGKNLLLNFDPKPSISKQQTLPNIRSNLDSSKTIDVKPKKKVKLSCYLCTNVYKSENSYIEHMSVHKVPKSELFSCQTCGKKFDCARNYYLHISIHRPKFSCSSCGSSYSRQEKLNRHIDSVHKAKRPHKCHFCLKAFSRLEYLKNHLNIHTGTKFECNTCGKLFSSKHNLTMHKKIHSNFKGFKCDYCERSFLRRSFLSTHIQKDHKNKRFPCDDCHKLFSRIDALKRHKAVHENSRIKFSCHICKKSYSRKHILDTHLKTHEDSVSLKCDLCPAIFKKKQSLQKHLKIHKIKEQCNICYKFMPSSQRLQNHLLWHEKQLKLRFEREYFGSVQCDLCPKSFSSQQLLNRHRTRSHKQIQDDGESLKTFNEREKKFFCQHCSKAFTRSCNLKAHMKTHNNESEDEEMLAGLPSVLNASKSSNAKVKKTAPVADNEAKYMRLENYTSKIGEINPLAASAFPAPLEDLSNIAHTNHIPYTAHAYEYSPANTYLNTASPTSPINLSAEAITAAAYLLAYPSYPGPYH